MCTESGFRGGAPGERRHIHRPLRITSNKDESILATHKASLKDNHIPPSSGRISRPPATFPEQHTNHQTWSNNDDDILHISHHDPHIPRLATLLLRDRALRHVRHLISLIPLLGLHFAWTIFATFVYEYPHIDTLALYIYIPHACLFLIFREEVRIRCFTT